MAKANLYSISGSKKGSVKLPSSFDEKVNVDLLSQALYVYQDRKHPGLSRAKTRGEVNISTRKIYRQKGTGGARHGAKSAPIFVGGGVAHGPKGIKRQLHLSKNLKRKALQITLALKADQGKIYLVDGLAEVKKTQQIYKLLKKMFEGKVLPRITFAVSDASSKATGAIKNISGIIIKNYKDLNAWDVYFAGELIIDNTVFGKKVIRKVGVIKKKEVKKIIPKKLRNK